MDTGETKPNRAHQQDRVTGIDVNGRLMASASMHSVVLWDVPSRGIRRSFEIPGPNGNSLVSITPDGRWIAIRRQDSTRVTVFNGEGGGVYRELPTEFEIADLDFSGDGAWLLVGGIEGTLVQFETNDWQEVGRYHLRTHQLNSVTFSNDSTRLAAVGDSGRISIWDAVPSGDDALECDGAPIFSVKHSPGGRFLAIGKEDGSVEIRAAYSRKLLFTTPVLSEYPDYQDPVFGFSPDERYLAVGGSQGQDAVTIWDLVTFEAMANLPHDDEVSGLAYAPNDTWLATASRSGIRLWDITERKVIRQFGKGPIECIAIAPDGKHMVTKGWDNVGIKVWDVASAQQVALLDGHVEPIGDTQTLRFSPDGTLLASGGYDAQAILWDTRTWEPVHHLRGYKGQIVEMSFSPDGSRIAVTATDNRCALWDVASGRELMQFPGLAVDFSTDGNTLTIAGEAALGEARKEGTPGQTRVRFYRVPAVAE
ncbi:MAG: WD40 repeat domain-containing protein [Verrucomicrobiales bacterium]